MSILDRDGFDNPVPPEKIAARRLLSMTKNTFDQMVRSFNEGSRIFWQNPNGATPAQVAEELGNDAAEVFSLHAKLGNLIGQVKPEAIQDGLNIVGDFTINEDGTVTING